MEDFIEKIGIDNELKKKVLPLCEKENIKALASKFDESFKSISLKDDLTKLAVCLVYANTATKAEFQCLNIPPHIFYATMSDIAIWCENNDNKGLKNIGWIKNHLKCQIFRIGRLQFQLYPCKNKTLDYSKLPFKYGENLIYIHIPQGEKLYYPDCVNSIKWAKAFFADLFPNYEYTYFFCESWLLFEDNWMFMAPNSNILQFQSLFEIVYNITSDHQAIERIFGKRHFIKALYPTKTSLQKSTFEFIKHGGKLGEGIGIINKNEI